MAAEDGHAVANGNADVQSFLANGPPDINTTNGDSSAAESGKKNREADKRRRRRQKKKKAKNAGPEKQEEDNMEVADEMPDGVEVEYVPEPPVLNPEAAGEGFEDLMKVFEKFSTWEPKQEEVAEATEEAPAAKPAENDSDSEEDDGDKNQKGLSNKERKLKRRMKIAELKQVAPRPDVVEIWDTTAADPKLLVFLKSHRNSVPVPRHWSQKRKYLQGKRGIEKTPFQLPDFIAATGIEKIRQAYIEKEDQKKLKQKQREKMQPKMGKMDIDYQVLHDAFFKYQTKPKLTHHGDVYYEGKEFEVKIREYKPGQLSDEVKTALGMTEGAPPPWLINMQRYGPPPSYPHLKIPGLNAPIPEDCSFGYHPGGWGKPPVDELGRPIYGDVFGVAQEDEDTFEDEPVDRSKHWGDLEEEEDEEEEEEEEEAVDEEEMEAGITSVDSLSTTPAGVETPDVIDLRKAQRKEPEKNLYTVLEEKEERVGAGTLMGTSHTYVLPGAGAAAAAGAAAGAAAAAAAGKKVDLIKSQKTDKVDITLRPEELEGLDDYALAAKYEQARLEEKVPEREDFSDMVAQREMQRKRKAQDKEGKSKKQKDFKF